MRSLPPECGGRGAVAKGTMYRLLIVDDEEDIRRGLAELFPWAETGFEVAGTAENGRQAFELVAAGGVDAVFSDIRMPVMSGIDLAKALNAAMVGMTTLEPYSYSNLSEYRPETLDDYEARMDQVGAERLAKLADMATLVEAGREFTYRVAAKINAGENQVKEVSMAKNFACKVSNQVTFDATQIFGGYGFMRGYVVERLYRDNRIMSIGGGTSEIMNEIISKIILSESKF